MRRGWRPSVGALVAGLLGTTGVVVATAFPAGTAVAATTALHVDCGSSPGGDGSLARPLDTLDAASAAALVPGQRLLFRRGTVCTGTLDLQSSGVAGDPIVVGAYGSGPMPRIDGTGEDAVLLDSVSYMVVKDLEVTNQGSTIARRRGVHVVADGVTVRGVTVRNLYVHDVDGDLAKDTGGSGGIQLDALGTAPAGRFDGVLVQDNRVENVSRSGIFVEGTQDHDRPPASQAWAAGSTGVVIEGNSLDHLAGDGIVPTGTVGALVEDNSVTDGNRAGTPFAGTDAICDAGIWTFNANGTVIRGNSVSDMEFNGCDGTGYDVDYDQDGTVVEGNYSHDNAGGFILLCTDPEVRSAEVRFNLSVDDAATVSEAPCAFVGGGLGTLDGMRFYNNTIVAPAPSVTLELIPLPALFDAGSFEFRNNIVEATVPQSGALPCGPQCSNNLFYGLPPSGTSAVVGDPRFTNPNRQGTGRRAAAKGFRLRPGSPARGAGVAIPGGSSEDFFGDPVPAAGPPAIGFDQPS